MLTINKQVNQSAAGARAGRSRKGRGFWYGMLGRALDEDRGRRGEPPRLSADEVLAWGSAFFGRIGDWPNHTSGPIPEAPGETWLLIAAALARGLRGLPCSGTLARFFSERRGRFKPADMKLCDEQIVAWADAWLERTGDWPTHDSGLILSGGRITWRLVDLALRAGRGELREEGSLEEFLASRRGVARARLKVVKILAWADAYHKRAAHWPSDVCGPVAEARTESWREIDHALAAGLRGLAGGSSLAGLLAEKRKVRNEGEPRKLALAEILEWADAYHERTGTWPDSESGVIPESPGDDWSDVQHALVWGGRGLDGDSSILKLLAEQRRVTHKLHSPELTFPLILSWADTFHTSNGQWPTRYSGPVGVALGETWRSIDVAIRYGCRGVPGGWTLARLLSQKRTKKDLARRPRLTDKQILKWADVHRKVTGMWPSARSGAVSGAAGENWASIQQCLRLGFRGLNGGRTLLGLLRANRNMVLQSKPRRLTTQRILGWADAHHARTGRWPTARQDLIPESPGDNWRIVSEALYAGTRGLPGGSSLSQLLAEQRGVPDRYRRQGLSYSRILQWADQFHDRTGRWPTSRCGLVADAPGETWGGIDYALLVGCRGLPGGISLARLLTIERGIRCRAHRPALSLSEITRWALAHRDRTGRWPKPESAVIPESWGDTWRAVDSALRFGSRGLEGGMSLTRLQSIESASSSERGHPSGLSVVSPAVTRTLAKRQRASQVATDSIRPSISLEKRPFYARHHHADTALLSQCEIRTRILVPGGGGASAQGDESRAEKARRPA